jgi:hypothetical protein
LRSRTRNNFCSRGSRFVEIFRHGKKQKINRDFPIKTCGHSSFDKPLFAALRHLNLKKFVFFDPPKVLLFSKLPKQKNLEKNLIERCGLESEGLKVYALGFRVYGTGSMA